MFTVLDFYMLTYFPIWMFIDSYFKHWGSNKLSILWPFASESWPQEYLFMPSENRGNNVFCHTSANQTLLLQLRTVNKGEEWKHLTVTKRGNKIHWVNLLQTWQEIIRCWCSLGYGFTELSFICLLSTHVNFSENIWIKKVQLYL